MISTKEQRISGFGTHGGRFFRLRRTCRLSFRRKLLPIAAFFEAGVHRANLGLLFDDKRRTALRTRLRHGHVRCSEITIGIPRATIKNPRPPTSTLAGATSTHKFAFIALRAFDPHGDRARVFALRISGATDELAEAPVLLDQMIPAKR